MKLYDYILNTKQESYFITGVVNSLSPLSVQIYADDSAILCKAVSSLIGLKIGSNVIVQKIGSQFIIIGVIRSSDLSDTYDVVDDISTLNDAITVLEWHRSRYVKKSSDTSRYNTATTTVDPHLTFSSFSSTGIYEVEINLYITYSSDPAIGIRCGWTTTGGVSQLTKRHVIGVSHTEWHATQWVANDLSYELAFGGKSNYIYSAREKFLISVSSAGSITFKWAQWTAETLNTTLKADSYMKITKLVS